MINLKRKNKEILRINKYYLKMQHKILTKKQNN